MTVWSNRIKNTVQIWRADLDRDTDKINLMYSQLSSPEKKRADRFVQPEDRRRFIISHGILRHLLAAYTGVPCSEIKFQTSEKGKPHLCSAINEAGLQFNMTDSKSFAMYAFALQREVGIDIEWQRPDIDFAGIVERFFTDQEKQEFLTLRASDRLRGFYRLWTRKEAYIKVLGLGLSFALNRFDVSIQADDMHALLAIDGSTIEAKKWLLGSIEAPQGYEAALALAGPFDVERIEYYDWHQDSTHL